MTLIVSGEPARARRDTRVRAESRPVESPSRTARYRTLDHWRGVACLAVVIYHVPERLYPDLASRSAVDPIARGVLGVCQAGASGVALFFVISGYCIAAAADPSRRGAGGAWEFARRRALRIGPPFWAALAFTAALSGLLWRAGRQGWLAGPCWGVIGDPLAMSGRQWAGNVLLSEPWLSRWAGPDGPSGLLLGPSWTLCYEAQFYAITAILLAVAPKRIFALSAGLAALAAAVLALRKMPAAAALDGTCLDGRWITFFLGMIVYRYVNRARATSSMVVPSALAIASAAGFAAGLGRNLILHEILVGSAFAAVLCLLHRFDGPINASRLASPLAWFGAISYSLYLMHWPVGRLIMGVSGELGLMDATAGRAVAVGLGVAGSVLAGWAFHVLIERRTLRST